MTDMTKETLEKIRQIYPYMEKKCALCAWALPSADMDSEGAWCRHFDKDVDLRQPACDYYINYYVRFLL